VFLKVIKAQIFTTPRGSLSWPRLLVAGLSSFISGFSPELFYVVFVVTK
jgi:hypothetical protein